MFSSSDTWIFIRSIFLATDTIRFHCFYIVYSTTFRIFSTLSGILIPSFISLCSINSLFHCTENHFFFFSDILHLRRKMKDDLSQKNTWKYDIFLKLFEKMVFSKRAALGLDLYCIIWKDGIFFPKTWYFFLWEEVRDDLSEEINGNMIFSVYTWRCYKRGATPLCQKKKIKNGLIAQKRT